jgi:fatty acid desaturase
MTRNAPTRTNRAPRTARAPRVATISSRPRHLEWPTLLVVVSVIISYLTVTAFHRRLPTVVVIASLAVLSSWHGSVQHEIIHGHISRRRFVRVALGLPTMNLWLPFLSYEQSHLRHHHDEHLTDPTDDPESWYRSAENWASCNRLLRGLLWCNRTLLGRLLLGPALAIVGFVRSEMVAARQPSTGRVTVRAWVSHVPMVVVTVVWLSVCGVTWWHYAAGSVYLGSSVTLFRSFAEHRWMPDGVSKTSMVRTNPIMSLLYLNNNLHLAHHLWAGTPWYRLPAVARELQVDQIAAAGSGAYSSYFDVARRYLFRPFCQPVHPSRAGAISPPLPWSRSRQ